MRYFLEISYVGTHFHGWQIQQNALSVQGELEQAISTILRTKTDITGSGRTDTGVHARHQVAHFDSIRDINCTDLTYKLNSLLSKDIAIKQIRQVTENAHARFDATERSYIYCIHSRKNPFLGGLSYYFKPDLDLRGIDKACARLKVWKDFECFSKVKTEVNNFKCTITRANWVQTSDGFEFRISANRFLRGMVRAIVGTLIDVGQNKLSLSEFDSILEGRNRSNAGAAAPAHGLFLSDVNYPESIYL